MPPVYSSLSRPTLALVHRFVQRWDLHTRQLDDGRYVCVREPLWPCFAGCGGGSVIDFYTKWRECDFTRAIGELAAMLL